MRPRLHSAVSTQVFKRLASFARGFRISEDLILIRPPSPTVVSRISNSNIVDSSGPDFAIAAIEVPMIVTATIRVAFIAIAVSRCSGSLSGGLIDHFDDICHV